jgi:hypothetical protein
VETTSILNSSSLSVRKWNGQVITFGMFLLLAGFPLSVITGDKYHYYIFSALCLLLFLFNLSSYINIYKAIYFVPLLISCVFNSITQAIDKIFILSILPYIIIPAIFFNRSFSRFDMQQLMKLFDFFTLFNLFGLLLQIADVQSRFLYQGLLYDDDGVHLRYGSFSGGTLGLGFVGSVSAINAFYRIIYYKERSFYNTMILLCAWSSLLLGLSRRFYVLTFIIMVIIFIFDANRNLSKKKLNKVLIISIGSVALILYLLFQFQDQSLLLKRAFSIADFENDDSNIMRLAKWVSAFETFINHFWMGKGIGSVGMIGKVIEEGDNVAELDVAESFFLKTFVECGVIFGTVFFILMISFVKRSFKALKNRDTALAGFFIIFFAIDSIMSTSLEGPIGAVLFWLSVSIVCFQNISHKSIKIFSYQ